MKFSVNLEIDELNSNIENDIRKLFELEDKNFNNRASYDIIKDDNKLIFRITAQDAVALRSCLSAITKTLSIYERTSNIVNK